MSKNDQNRQEAQQLTKELKKLKISKDPRVPCKFCGLISVKSQQARHRKRDYECKVIRAKLEVKQALEALEKKQANLRALLAKPPKRAVKSGKR